MISAFASFLMAMYMMVDIKVSVEKDDAHAWYFRVARRDLWKKGMLESSSFGMGFASGTDCTG